jgi:hypothetical protein
MTTTTRIDTPLSLVEEVLPGADIQTSFWGSHGLKGRKASRWAGVDHPRWRCWSFSIRLPRDLAAAWKLRTACERLLADRDDPFGAGRQVFPGGPTASKPLGTLLGKLDAILGWTGEPASAPGTPARRLEESFRDSIRASGGTELASWSAYADWLAERDPEDRNARTIQQWLSREVFSLKRRKEQKLRDDIRNLRLRIARVIPNE